MEKAAHAAPAQTCPAFAAPRAGGGDPFDELFDEPLGSVLPTL
jgi:hypothetical protein